MLLSPIESEIIFRKALEEGTDFSLNNVPIKCRFTEEFAGSGQVATISFHRDGFEFSFSAKVMGKDGIVIAKRTSPIEKKEKTAEKAFLTLYFNGGEIFCYLDKGKGDKNSAVIEKLDGKSLKIKTDASFEGIKIGEKITVELNRRPLPIRFTGIAEISEKNTREIAFPDIPAEVARPLNENPVIKPISE
jgi:hypothetical protein